MFYQFHHHATADYLKVEYGQDFSFPLHLHQCFEVIVLLDGNMRVVVNEQEYHLSQGDALLIFPNQIHSLSSENSRHVLCIFSPMLVQAFSTKRIACTPTSNLFRPDPYLIHALDQLTPQCDSAQKKGVLYLLCHQFDASAEYREADGDRKNLLHKIFSEVELRYRENCSLAVLAEKIGYDYSYLSRYFKKNVGISFNTYLNNYRLSQACYLMENTDMPIIECAYESGFSSLRSFNRNFRQRFGMSPSDYRDELRKTTVLS